MTEINVTPFVDVMLVLLVIFMVTSPLIVANINIDLPETNASPVAGQDEPITITINAKGQIYMQDMLVDVMQLEKQLKIITKEKLDKRIMVQGDKRADYGKIMDVIDRINTIGFNKVGLITNIREKKK